MKLQSVVTARSIWLGHLSDLNPRGINLIPIIVPLLAETYKFIQLPSIQDISNSKDGLKFQQGEFAIDDGYPIRINFTLYEDGLVADSGSSTDHSEAFLEDVLVKFSDTFNVLNCERVISRKNYLSEMFVSTDTSLELINPKLKQVSDYLADNVEENKIFEVGRISFFPNQTSKINPAPFSLERALNVPFSENRYYTIAPLQTHKHLELLELLEISLLSK